MNTIGVSAIISIVALAVAGLVILVMCVHYEITKRATFKRFDAATDAYQDMFGADKTLVILNAAQKTDMCLDDIAQIMEKAVKTGKEIVCS